MAFRCTNCNPITIKSIIDADAPDEPPAACDLWIGGGDRDATFFFTLLIGRAAFSGFGFLARPAQCPERPDQLLATQCA